MTETFEKLFFVSLRVDLQFLSMSNFLKNTSFPITVRNLALHYLLVTTVSEYVTISFFFDVRNVENLYSYIY